MVRPIFKAKTAQVNSAATAASAYCHDLENWPLSWMGLEKDLPPGEALLVCFFFQAEDGIRDYKVTADVCSSDLATLRAASERSELCLDCQSQTCTLASL